MNEMDLLCSLLGDGNASNGNFHPRKSSVDHERMKELSAATALESSLGENGINRLFQISSFRSRCEIE